MLLPYKLISVTGTKGKTSIIRMLDYLFFKNGKTTLRVDTDGHFFNGQQRSTAEDSLRVYKLLPTVSPGRYLYEFQNEIEENRWHNVAILESSIGCSRLSGMGYFKHHIGVFTNVYEDHIDNKRIKNPNDIFEKKFLFISKIFSKGHYIYNYDDLLVKESRNLLSRKIHLIAVSLNYSIKELKQKLRKEKYILTVKDNFIIYYDQKRKEHKLLNLNKFKYIPALYKPMLYSLLFVSAVALAYGFKKKHLKVLYDYDLDISGKRMTLLRKNDLFVLLDYAHEKYSLLELENYIKQFNLESLALLRLDPKREYKLIKETGKFIANFFDRIIVYDKIDGVNLSYMYYRGRKRKKGEISKLLYDSIKKHRKKNKMVYRRLVELEAFDLALEKLKDIEKKIIIWIVNDVKTDIDYLQNKGFQKIPFEELMKFFNEKKAFK